MNIHTTARPPCQAAGSADQEHLEKVFRLLFGTSAAGEIENARRALERILGTDREGLIRRLADTLARAKPEDSAATLRTTVHPGPPITWTQIAVWCQGRPECLTSDERRLVEDTVDYIDRNRRPPDEQLRQMRGIYDRLKREEVR